ncbi:MAG: hypothetical protein IKW81_06270 [Pseudobutyrivibrio sp.]|nr:hypothetical protein [Pseudobutyrivibrio sp.]
MSEALRTFPEYVEHYAKAKHISYEEAMEHAIVKAFELMKGESHVEKR